jgi:FkbM family methyltransferase
MNGMDLVVVNNSRQIPAYMAIRAAARRGVPAVLFPHNVDTQAFATPGRVGVGARAYFAVANLWDGVAVPRMLRHAKLMVLSRREQELAREQWGASATFLRYPVVIGDRPTLSDDDTLRLVWAARFVHQKAPDLALAAARQASTRVKVALDFYGNGPLLAETRHQADDLPWVHFHGEVSPEEVRAAQTAAGAVVFSSSMAEGAQLSILEALCAGVPAVVTAAGDARSYYPEDLAWACVEPGDVGALADALERLAGSRDPAVEAFAANGARLRVLHGAGAERALVDAIVSAADGRQGYMRASGGTGTAVIRGLRLLARFRRDYEPRLSRDEAFAQGMAVLRGRRAGFGEGRDHDGLVARGYCHRRGGPNLWLRPGGGDSAVWGEIEMRDAYVPPWPLPPNLRVLDIGAHCGYFALWAFRHWSIVSLLSLEPDTGNADVLVRNQESLDDPRWSVMRAAAATHEGYASLFGGRGSGSGLGGAGEDTVPTVDALELLAGCNLAKIDIEGGEWPLVADPRFAAAAPAWLVIEYHPAAGIDDPAAEMRQRLASAGYELVEGHHEAAGVGIYWGRRRR